jgi:hypothetical protein
MRMKQIRRVFVGIALGIVLIGTTARADVTCKDGTISTVSGRGACSHHGGIAKAGAAAAPSSSVNRAPTAKGEQDGTGAPPTVSCKDGTQSKGGRGACSRHGGVADAAPNGPSGAPVAAPAQEGAGETAGVMCKDGSRSATSGRGACSHHGGIAAVGGAGAPAPADERAHSTTGAEPRGDETTGKHTDPTGATAQCKDGSYSHSQRHSGSCSHHGGVAKWLNE